MLLYTLPARPSTNRVYVWRKLKSCGVLYWQHSVCLLPLRPGLAEQLERLKNEIGSRGGEATISTIQFADPQEHAAIVEKFRQQADEEYQEFLDKCRDFHAELAMERKNQHFTFAELDENDAELAKLCSWLPKIRKRDFFGAALDSQAQKALHASERDFAQFSRTIAETNERNLIQAGAAKKRKK